MTRPGSRLAAAVIAPIMLTLALRGQTAPPAQTPPPQTTFRAAADVVTIDVSVRTSGTPVAGLHAADFVLTDNGVRQTVEVVALEAVPVDITILIETSEDHADDIEGLTGHIREMAALARPTDRLRLMSIGTYVTDLIPVREAAAFMPPPALATGGLSSAYDAIAAALLREVGTDRRHLIVAMTNGIDATSALDAAAVRDIARRSDATLHIAQIDMVQRPGVPPAYRSGREGLLGARCAAALLCQPTRRFWRPYDAHEFEILTEAAAATGGGLHLPGVFTDRTAAAIFERVFADYRRSYLLRYTPTGVGRAGWHDVEVTLPSRPEYAIQARRGYAVDAGLVDSTAAPASTRSAAAEASPAISPAVSRAPAVPVTIDDFVAAYDREDYAAVDEGLRRSTDIAGFIRDWRLASSPWLARPRREAAFVLEIARAAMHSRRPAWRTAAADLLKAQHRLIRNPVEPDAFERYWLWTQIAMLEAANQPALASDFVDAALVRFPDEARFVLARALVLDQLHTPRIPTAAGGGAVTAAARRLVDDVAAAYDAAAGFDATAAEARLRKAWLLHRVGRHDEALALLDVAATGGGTTPDAHVLFLRDLLRGRVHDALDRPDAAAGAYRSALLAAPEAQSARVGLMSALLRQGDRRGAEALAESIQTAGETGIDPWWSFWLGDFRHYGEMIQRLREQTR